MLLDRLRIRVRRRAQRRSGLAVAAPLADRGKWTQRRDQEPGGPDALAAAMNADSIHSVVPVAASDQRQPVLALRAGPLERSYAVLVYRGLFFRDLREVVHLVLVGIQLAHGQKWRGLVEHALVTGYGDIAIDDVRQPDEVVREASAHAASRLWMPPVLHVAFHELPGGSAHDLLSRHRGLGVQQRRRILQLVAEA